MKIKKNFRLKPVKTDSELFKFKIINKIVWNAIFVVREKPNGHNVNALVYSIFVHSTLIIRRLSKSIFIILSSVSYLFVV